MDLQDHSRKRSDCKRAIARYREQNRQAREQSATQPQYYQGYDAATGKHKTTSVNGDRTYRKIITNGAIGIGQAVDATGDRVDATSRVKKPVATVIAAAAKAKKPTIKYLYSFVRSGDPPMLEFYAAGWQQNPVLVLEIPYEVDPYFNLKTAKINNLNYAAWTVDISYLSDRVETTLPDSDRVETTYSNIQFINIDSSGQKFHLTKVLINYFLASLLRIDVPVGAIGTSIFVSHGFWLVKRAFETSGSDVILDQYERTITSQNCSWHDYDARTIYDWTPGNRGRQHLWIKNKIASTPIDTGRFDYRQASIDDFFLDMTNRWSLLPTGYTEETRYAEEGSNPPPAGIGGAFGNNLIAASEFQLFETHCLTVDGRQGLGRIERFSYRFPDESKHYAAWFYNDGAANRTRRFAVGGHTLAGELSNYDTATTYLYASAFTRKFAYCDRVVNIDLIQNQPITTIADQFKAGATYWFDRSPVPNGTPENLGFIDTDLPSKKNATFKVAVKVVDLQKTIGGQMIVVPSDQITEETVEVYKIPETIRRQVLQGTLTEFKIHNAAYAP